MIRKKLKLCQIEAKDCHLGVTIFGTCADCIKQVYCPSCDGDRTDLAVWTSTTKKLAIYGFFANSHGY